MDPKIKQRLLQKQAQKNGLELPETTPPIDTISPEGTPNRNTEPTRFIVTDGKEYDSSREDSLGKVQDAGWRVLIKNYETGEEDIVTPKNLRKAEAAGWSAVTEFDYKLKDQTKKDEQLYEDTKESELMSFGRGIADTVTLGTDDEISAGIKTAYDKITGGDSTYTENRDAIRRNKDRAFEDNTGSTLAGNIIGSVIPGMGVTKVAKGIAGASSLAPKVGNALTKVDKITNFGKKALPFATASAGEGGLYGLGSSKEEDLAGMAKDTAIGAGIGAGASLGMDIAGAGVKAGAKGAGKATSYVADKLQLGRLVPGSEAAKDGLTNKFVAWVSGKLPINNFDEDEIYELLNNPEMRKKVAQGSSIDISTLKKKLTAALDSVDDDIGRAYNQKEEAFTAISSDKKTMGRVEEIEDLIDSGDISSEQAKLYIKELTDEQKDLRAYLSASDDIEGILTKIKENPSYYESSTKKLINNVDDMLRGGSTPVDNPESNLKRSLLVARRYLDDKVKNKNFSNMGKFDREAILDARSAVDRKLKTAMTKSEEMIDADNLFREYQERKGMALDPIKGQGNNSISRPKLDSMMRSQREKGKEFFEHIDDFGEFAKNNPLLKDSPAVESALTAMKELKDEISFKQLQYKIEKSGGPSSPEIRNLMQVAGAFLSGGKTLLFGPVLNPPQYIQTRDALSKLVEYGVLDSGVVSTLTNSIEKATPVVRSALLRETIRQKQESKNK